MMSSKTDGINEFFELLKRFDLKGILLVPTKNGFLQFLRYVFVGGTATVVDWALLFVLTEYAHIYYLVSNILSFFAGLGINYTFSKMLVFKASEARVNAVMEFFGYALIAAVGLGMTELIMYLLTNQGGVHYMLSKAIASFAVLAWNYLARKNLLYKK